jgi:hypothetical protein
LIELLSLPGALADGILSAVQEPRVWFIVAVSLLGGVVRGYSGFGGALIVVPLAAMAVGPTMAVPLFYLFDLGSATPYGYRALPKCNWPQVWPMLIGHLLALPLGTWILTNLHAEGVRWGMSATVFLMLAILISGWRYRGRPNPPASFGVGTLAGVMGSSSGMAGPPVIAYWLGQKNDMAVVRNNIMAYYALTSTATDIYFFSLGLFTWQVLIYALVVWPFYAMGLWAGAKLFHRSTEAFFRLSAYGLIAVSAVVSMPLLDHLFRR